MVYCSYGRRIQNEYDIYYLAKTHRGTNQWKDGRILLTRTSDWLTVTDNVEKSSLQLRRLGRIERTALLILALLTAIRSNQIPRSSFAVPIIVTDYDKSY